MKFFLFLTISAIAVATTGYAQPLALRSGDHPTFSRITIPLPESQLWEAKRTDKGVVIKLPGFEGGFDTSSVFDRMRPDHISAFDATSDRLVLKVECDCIAATFRSGSLLVIDVALEGVTLAGSRIENYALSSEVRSTPTRSSPPFAAALPWIGNNSPFGVVITPNNNTDLVTSRTPSEPLQNERTEILKEMQNKLLERVANATSIGLLDSNYEEPSELFIPSNPPERRDMLEPERLPDAIIAPSRNIRISSSMDLPISISSSESITTSSGVTCPIDNSLPVETWGSESSFSAQIGQARNALMNARDKLDTDAAKELAQLYVYFGFGAEALDVLRLDQEMMINHSQLAALATILERGAIPRPNAISQFTDCDSNIALWATLSFEEIPSGTFINMNATLRALNKLPKQLRRIVAPALSDRLLRYGDSSAAATAMRSIERLSEPLASDALLSQASLAIEAGRAAETVLENVIEANSAQSPVALVKLVEGKLANNEPLNLETAKLVEAYAQELRGTEIGNKLRRTQVIALSQSQKFDEAFSALATITPSLSLEAETDLKNTIIVQLVRNSDDLTFLEQFFAEDLDELGTLPSATKLAITKRMIDLGFAAQAQQLLSTFSKTTFSNERQILAARTALLLRQPFQAQAALIGAEGPDVTLLLAEAKEQAGAFREASELFASANATTQAAQAAWLSDDWKEILDRNTPSLGAVITIAQDNLDQQAVVLGPLTRANIALEESGTARDTLEQLLSDPMVQVSPGS